MALIPIEVLGAPSQKTSLLGGVAQILINLRPSPRLADVGLFVRPKSQHLWANIFVLEVPLPLPELLPHAPQVINIGVVGEEYRISGGWVECTHVFIVWLDRILGQVHRPMRNVLHGAWTMTGVVTHAVWRPKKSFVVFPLEITCLWKQYCFQYNTFMICLVYTMPQRGMQNIVNVCFMLLEDDS